MNHVNPRRVSYQALSRRLTCVAETIDAARNYLAHAVHDAPPDYTDMISLDRSLVGLYDLMAILRDLRDKAHAQSEGP